MMLKVEMILEKQELMPDDIVTRLELTLRISWSLHKPLGTSWSLLKPPGASWSLLESPGISCIS